MKTAKGDQAAGDSDDSGSGEDGDRAAESGRLLVAAGESSVGTIGYDDLGQPRWTWITELAGSGEAAAEDTFDYIKALDNSTLAVADEPGAREQGGKKESGYDPYDTARIKIKGKVPWR